MVGSKKITDNERSMFHAEMTCPHFFWLRPRGADNTPSKRRHRCCDLKPSFMLKGMKCVGKYSGDCPLNKKEIDNGQE